MALESIENKIIASAAQSKATLKYLSSRIAEVHFEHQHTRQLWQRLLNGETIKPPEEPVSDPATLAALVSELKVSYAIRQIKALSYSAINILNGSGPADPDKFIKSFVRGASKISHAFRTEKILGAQGWLEVGQEEVLRRQKSPPAINLYLRNLSRQISAEPGHLVIIAARWGKGKTALALNIAADLGMRQNIPTLYLNTEMSLAELSLRLYALLGRITLADLRAGNPKTAGTDILSQIKAGHASGKLWISDSLPWLTLSEVEAIAREYAATVGLKVMILDYIQKLDTGPKDRWLGLLEASTHLKNLAQELGLLIIALSQKSGDDLAGSKQIQQDADAVLFLDESDEVGATHVIKTEKSRHMALGPPIFLRMDPRTLEIVEVVGGEDPFN